MSGEGKRRLFGGLLDLLGRDRVLRTRGLPVLAGTLLSTRGEASGVALAQQILAGYGSLSETEKLAFLRFLAEQFGPDPERLDRAISEYRSHPGARTATALHQAAEPRRQELFRRLNAAPGGTHELVRMRADLLRELADHEELAPAEADFVHLFSSWFNSGFLVLERIDWSTPAHILEKVIRHEAVHAIESWSDLQRRLDPRDRRCYAFFHPRLVQEPLIFVEVALTSDMPAEIAPLLAGPPAAGPPDRATTAVFYSISNSQPGLRGISLGSFLIKQVIEELKRELPGLRTFVTLSPVPGLLRWLRRERERGASSILTTAERAALEALDRPGWHEWPPARKGLKPVLLAAVAEYLLCAKNSSGRPIDPVARLHLDNGARLERVNWLADLSPRGIAQGAGFMVNYLYDPARIVENHETFANRGEVVASSSVRKLLRSRTRSAAADAPSSQPAPARERRPTGRGERR